MQNQEPPDACAREMGGVFGTEMEDRARFEFLNHPPFAMIRTWCRQHLPQYTDEELRLAWYTFQAVSEDGQWRWGTGHVTNWKQAMKLRLESDRNPKGRRGRR